MKTLTKLMFPTLTACLLLGTAIRSQAQVQVGVDPAKNWGGWMNVYELPANGGAYQWGSGWGAGALPAVFSSGVLTLSPNVNCWNASDGYWVNNGAPNKQMEANFYVTETSLGGNTVEFSGLTLANTLVSPYQSVAFIKEFTVSYDLVGIVTTSLTGGASFDLERAIGAGNIVQYGFMTTGPVADPAVVSTYGSVQVVATPEPSSAALLGLGLLSAFGLYRRRQ